MLNDTSSAQTALFQVAVPSQLENVRLLAEAAQKALANILDEEERIRLEIGLVEAANNIVHHACRDSGERTIWLSCFVDGRTTTLLLEDDGFPPDRDLTQCILELEDSPPPSFAESGRGLWLMGQCFASVLFEAGGDRNRLHLRFEGQAPA